MKLGTTSHPKFRRLMRQLSVSQLTSVGILESLWMLAAQFTEDGDVSRFSEEDIAAFIDWPDEPERLVTGLVDCGWLDRDGERLLIHDWDDHKPYFINERIKKRRQREETAQATSPRRVPGQSRGVPGESDLAQSSPVQNKNAANKSPKPSSESSSRERQSYPDDFERFWSAYPANDKGRKRGKQTSYTHWQKVPKADRAQLVTAATNYASETTEFIRDPERFLKSDWWRDWIETAEATRTPAAQRFKPEDSL